MENPNNESMVKSSDLDEPNPEATTAAAPASDTENLNPRLVISDYSPSGVSTERSEPPLRSCRTIPTEPPFDTRAEMVQGRGASASCNEQGILVSTESGPRNVLWWHIDLVRQSLPWIVIVCSPGRPIKIKLTDLDGDSFRRDLLVYLKIHPEIKHEVTLDPLLPEFNRIVIPFWPYSSDADEQTNSKRKSDIVILLFFILWIGASVIFTPGLGVLSHGLSAWMYWFKLLPVFVLGLYAKTYSATRMTCDCYGICLDAEIGGNRWRKKLILWKRIKKMYITPAKPGQRALDRSLCFEMQDSLPYKLKLEKFATSKSWESFMQAVDAWSGAPLSAEDHKIFETVNVDQKDPTYTKLWLDALSAPIRREQLQPLSVNSSLQQGKYVLERKLGTGGQGTAYLAHDQSGAKCVLKEYILPVYVDAKVRRQALEAFEREAAMLSKLNNPAVVKLLDVFVEEHRGYLVLEFIDGVNLREYVGKHGAVPESKVWEWAFSMARILEYLHHQSPPVVHRDFTPDNLILLPDGTIKLIDFMVAQQEIESVTATVVGKHAYLPPEQFRGTATPQSDLYALGCTLHYLLTGSDPEPLMESHPILSTASVSGEMDEFVANCTSQDLLARYRESADLIEAINQHVAE